MGSVLIQPQQTVAGLEDPIGIEHDAHQSRHSIGLLFGFHLRKAGLLRGLYFLIRNRFWPLNLRFRQRRDGFGAFLVLRKHRLRTGRYPNFEHCGLLFSQSPSHGGFGSRVLGPIPHGWSRGLKDRPGRCAVGRMERAAAPRLNGHSHWAKMRCILCGSFVFLF